MNPRLPNLSVATPSAFRGSGSADPGASVAASALRVLAYSDVFGCPLSASEVQRYLVGVEAALPDVERALDSLVAAGTLRTEQGLFALASGDADFSRRRRLASGCDRSWGRARRWGTAIARLPFVRMVAITGSLAADNPEGEDLDYFVVTAAGRLWTCRALIIQLVVRPARLFGDVVCPNYLLAGDRLALGERDGFVARELAQMAPLAGFDVYRALRQANPWATEILPNAGGPPPRAAAREPPLAGRALSRAVEICLSGRAGEACERFEMRRKIRELERRHGSGGPEVELGEGCCKGHYSQHGRRILAAWRERLGALGLEEDPGSTGSAWTGLVPTPPDLPAREST